MPSSPELTGGSGFTFEDAVVGYYLAALLTESTARGLRAMTPATVSVQQAALGRPLDDLVVRANTPSGSASLDLQVKRAFRMSAAPSNADFFAVVDQVSRTLNAESFKIGVDRVGVATDEIAADHYRDVVTVCEWARDSWDASDFVRRIEAPGVGSQAKRSILQAVRDGLARTQQADASDENAHRFFRHFVLLRFDLLGEGAADLDLVMDRLRQGLNDSARDEAEDLWASLRTIARDASGRAGSFGRDNLRNRLGRPERFSTSHAFADDLRRLGAEAKLAFSTIAQEIDGVVAPRTELRLGLSADLASQRLVLVTGQPGSGKSALLRAAAESAVDRPMICLRSDRVEAGGWPAYARTLGVTEATPLALLREMACAGEPILFVDGIDRIVGRSRALIQELVTPLCEDPSLDRWRIVVSVRDGGWEQVRRWLPALRALPPAVCEVGSLTDIEATALAEQRPPLRELLFGAPDIREIVRRPFFLNVLASAVDLTAGVPSSETELIAAWWAGGGYDAEGPQKARRQEALMTLAKASAATLGRRARVRGLDPDALDSLRSDRLLIDVEPGHTVSFAHDIFFEWAFAHLLVDADETWRDELVAAGEPPALGRPVELLSQLRFERDDGWEDELVRLEAGRTRTQWLRAWLTAPPSSPRFPSQGATFSAAIFRHPTSARLTNLLTWFQAVRSEPGSRTWALLGDLSETDAIRLADVLAIPNDFPTWARLLRWLLSEHERLPDRLWPRVLTCAEVWQNGVGRVSNDVSEGLLGLAEAWLAALETAGDDPKRARSGAEGLSHDAEKALRASLRAFIFRAAVPYPDATQRYLARLLAERGHRREAFEAIVDSAAFVARADPKGLADLILQIAMSRLPRAQLQFENAREERSRAEAMKHPEGSRERQLLMPSGLGGWINSWDWDHLAIHGLEHLIRAPSPVTELLRSLFKEQPELALQTVKALANHATAAWRELHELDPQRGKTPLPLVLDFPWGRQSFTGAEREYLLFRGVFEPQLLTAGLMVLEAWAFEQLEGGADIDALLKQVIEGCEHNAILGIATALALTQAAATPATLPLATSPRLWRWELARIARVENGSPANLIPAMGRRRDLIALQASNARPARHFWIAALATPFMAAADAKLRESFRSAVAQFGSAPAADFAEELQDEGLVKERRRQAAGWTRFADPDTYLVTRTQDEIRIEVRPPTPADEREAESFAAADQMSRSMGLALWAARTLEEDAAPHEGGLTDAQAVDEGRALDEPDLFARGGGLGDLEDMRRAGVAGVAAFVLRDLDRYQDEDLVAWAQDVVVRAYATPLGGEGWIGAESVLPFHALKYVPAGLAGMLRRHRPIDGVGPALLGMTAHHVHQISTAAACAAYSLSDVEPALSRAALQLVATLGVRADSALTYRRDRRAALDARIAATNAAYAAALTVAAGETTFALPAFPIRHDEEDGEIGEKVSDEPWLDTKFLAAHLPGLSRPPPELRDQVDALGVRLLAWTIDQVQPRRRRSRSRLIIWRATLMQWLAARADPADAGRVIEAIVVPICRLEDEACLELLNPFIGAFAARELHDADVVHPGALAVMAAAAARAAQLKPRAHWEYDAAPGALFRDLLCVPSTRAGGARRFANGDWSEIGLLWPTLDALLPALKGRVDFARAWLSLAELSIEYYPIERFAAEAVQVIAALPASDPRLPDVRTRLGAVLQALEDRAQPLGGGTRQYVLRILDFLVDGGDRRAAALQRSERYRLAPREASHAPKAARPPEPRSGSALEADVPHPSADRSVNGQCRD